MQTNRERGPRSKRDRLGRRIVTGAMGVAVFSMVSIATVGASVLEPAPGSESSATALQVRPAQTQVGGASAEAGPDGGSGSSTAVTVLGRDVAGTSASGEGQSEATLVSVPVGEGAVRVMPREASASRQDGTSQAAAYAALIDANVPGLVRLDVLSGDAEAAWTVRESTSRSSTDGVSASVLDDRLVVVLLHAEADGDGTGRLYVLRVNETTLVDSASMQPVTIEVPGLLKVVLLGVQATSGRSTSFTGEIVRGIPLDDDALAEINHAVRASGSTMNAVAGGEPQPEPNPRPDVTTAGRPDRLPFAGANAALLAQLALGLIASGGGLLGARRLWILVG